MSYMWSSLSKLLPFSTLVSVPAVASWTSRMQQAFIKSGRCQSFFLVNTPMLIRNFPTVLSRFRRTGRREIKIFSFYAYTLPLTQCIPISTHLHTSAGWRGEHALFGNIGLLVAFLLSFGSSNKILKQQKKFHSMLFTIIFVSEGKDKKAEGRCQFLWK